MHHRPFIIFMKFVTGALSITVELLSFYYLFLLFDGVLSNQGINQIYQTNALSNAAITAISAFCYKLLETIIFLGDELEAKGDKVWAQTKKKRQ